MKSEKKFIIIPVRLSISNCLSRALQKTEHVPLMKSACCAHFLTASKRYPGLQKKRTCSGMSEHYTPQQLPKRPKNIFIHIKEIYSGRLSFMNRRAKYVFFSPAFDKDNLFLLVVNGISSGLRRARSSVHLPGREPGERFTRIVTILRRGFHYTEVLS